MNLFTVDDLNMHTADISFIDLYNAGRAKDQAEKAAAEASKKFTLRAGTAGCLLSGGQIIGANPWEALARFMGYQVPKTKTSYDIFDGGFGNEAIWTGYLNKMSDEYTVRADTDYPLRIPEFAGGYPLTGRPDGVLWATGKEGALSGLELKVVAGASTAEKVLNGSPKTENLCQAGVYSLGFGLPWNLVYTSYVNFKTYKGAEGPGKSEYKIGWMDGKMVFTYKGVAVETVIDTRGILEFYQAIVEAYETKDHSWFRRDATDYLGEEGFYDPDSYNSFQLMVDNTASWKEWEEQARHADSSPLIIEYKTYRKQDIFKVVETSTGKLVAEYDDLNDARNRVRKGWKKNG